MTAAQTSATLPTVQTHKGGKLKPPECHSGRLTYRSIMRLLKGKAKGAAICDPAVEGLRWRRSDNKGSIVAEWRWKDRVTEARRGKTLGKLPTEAEMREMAIAFSEQLYRQRGVNGLGIVLDGDGFVERFRKEARRLYALRAAGQDPASSVGPEGLTVKQAFELHKEKMVNAGKSPLSIAEYELALSHLSDWEDVPLRRLEGKDGRRMVKERHQKLGKTRGPGAANKKMRAFRAWWNTAKKEDPDLGECPTIAVAWFTLAPRKSALRTSNLEQFGRELEALRAEGKYGELRADYLTLMLLTGMRKTALAKVRREHVDAKERLIYVPEPKGGNAFYLPLSDAAWEIVERRLAVSDSPWLFPSPTDPEKHISDVRADGAFSDWTDAAGKPVKFTRHGLRATFIGAGHAAGVSDRYMQLLANHKLHKGDVHGGYVPKDDLPALRRATQKITDYLREHGLPV